MSPPFQDGPGIRGVVGIPVYFSVDPDDWQPFSATATDGTYHLTVTATPTILEFDTGYNKETKPCLGPGIEIKTERQIEQANQIGCHYTYQQSTRENRDFDGQVKIIWTTKTTTYIEPASQITDLIPATITTSTDISIPMVEIQAVLR